MHTDMMILMNTLDYTEVDTVSTLYLAVAAEQVSTFHSPQEAELQCLSASADSLSSINLMAPKVPKVPGPSCHCFGISTSSLARK
eukprot:s28_g30.t1